jgi:simple sugar transport system ATP-binding protein
VAIDDHANRLVREFDIRTPSIHMAAQNLSGGNIQRLILAREISRDPELLIVSQPTRGLDVAATEFIRRKLCDQKQKGAAILLISDDLNEVLDLSDRVAVIYRGEIAGIVTSDECDISKIGLMMAGTAK